MVGTHLVLITTAKEDEALGDAGVMRGEKAPPRFRDGSVRYEVPPEGSDRADFDLAIPTP